MKNSNKTRRAVPRKVVDAVMAEYNHRCAICGSPNPHLHHIDEDPSNNAEHNLLPLCPNCHLSDHHDPTKKPDSDRLMLFRRYKDPAILNERFHPLWQRTRFLLNPDPYTFDQLHKMAEELIQFVSVLEMGNFYGSQLKLLIYKRRAPIVWTTSTPSSAFQQKEQRERMEYKIMLDNNRERALELIIELLRYQKWKLNGERPSN